MKNQVLDSSKKIIKAMSKLRQQKPILFSSREGWSFVALPAAVQPEWDEGLDFLREFVVGSKKMEFGQPPFTGGWVGVLSYPLGLEWMGLKSRHSVKKVPVQWWRYCDRGLAISPEGILHWFGMEPVDLEGDFAAKVFGLGELKSGWTFEEYKKAFAKVQGALKDGESYQVNLTQPFTADFSGDPLVLYLALWEVNPSQMGFYAEDSDWALVSNSPERLFSLQGRTLRAEPIKGTVGIEEDPAHLLRDTKSYAELTMIVDLLRNDLAKVSTSGSVKVLAHQALMKLKHLWHSYSVIESELRQGLDIVDVLKSLFPGGSVTGCPKERTLALIDQIESCGRGFYCGSAGYVSDSGNADFSILIRSATIFKKENRLEFPTGGGVVVDSTAEGEWAELMKKKASLQELVSRLKKASETPILYEALRSYRGVFLFLSEHQMRWKNGAKELGREVPNLELVLPNLSCASTDVRLRVNLFADGRTECVKEDLPFWNGSFEWAETWNFKVVKGARERAHLKHGDTDFQVQERSRAQGEGFQEILMVDENGWVREGGISNVFFVDFDGRLVTPNTGILPGIGRSFVLEVAKEMGLNVVLREVHESELEGMAGVFLCNSIRGLIRTGRDHPIFERLMEACGSAMKKRLRNHTERTSFMGVLNFTPDSFSDGGRFFEFGGDTSAVVVAKSMIQDGADLLDLGGESTRPGSQDVSVEEEVRRILPGFESIHQAFPNLLMSVDTWKSEVAEAAILAGAGLVNDVTAGRGDERIFEVAARHQVPIVLMYSKDSTPRTTREALQYQDVMATVKAFLKERIAVARSYGVQQIWVDPGMGAFVSGDPRYSWEIMDRIEELYELGCPILVGASRKGFLGEDILGGTLMSTLNLKGRVECLRVHDVSENVSAVASISN
jgi:dihydropteroate synthase